MSSEQEIIFRVTLEKLNELDYHTTVFQLHEIAIYFPELFVDEAAFITLKPVIEYVSRHDDLTMATSLLELFMLIAKTQNTRITEHLVAYLLPELDRIRYTYRLRQCFQNRAHIERLLVDICYFISLTEAGKQAVIARVQSILSLVFVEDISYATLFHFGTILHRGYEPSDLIPLKPRVNYFVESFATYWCFMTDAELEYNLNTLEELMKIPPLSQCITTSVTMLLDLISNHSQRPEKFHSRLCVILDKLPLSINMATIVQKNFTVDYIRVLYGIVHFQSKLGCFLGHVLFISGVSKLEILAQHYRFLTLL